MSERAEALAAQLEAVVRHVGGAYIVHARLVQAAASGEPIPAMFGDWNVIHQGNAISGEKYANADRGETIASLQRNGTNLAAAIRDLTDEQLDRAAIVPIFSDEARTVAEIIAFPVIDHPHGHLIGLRATVAGQS